MIETTFKNTLNYDIYSIMHLLHHSWKLNDGQTLTERMHLTNNLQGMTQIVVCLQKLRRLLDEPTHVDRTAVL